MDEYILSRVFIAVVGVVGVVGALTYLLDKCVSRHENAAEANSSPFPVSEQSIEQER